jgi:peptide-methionine (S)-S-oxide reductase
MEHHAVCSGCLEAVKVLVEAGASLTVKDQAWGATPLGWAEYYLREPQTKRSDNQYAEIADYLRTF